MNWFFLNNPNSSDKNKYRWRIYIEIKNARILFNLKNRAKENIINQLLELKGDNNEIFVWNMNTKEKIKFQKK